PRSPPRSWPGWSCPRLRHQCQEVLKAQDSDPFAAVPAMGHNGGFIPGVGLGLCERVVEVKSLRPLALDVNSGHGMHHVWRVVGAAILPPTAGSKAVVAQECGELQLAVLALVS